MVENHGDKIVIELSALLFTPAVVSLINGDTECLSVFQHFNKSCFIAFHRKSLRSLNIYIICSESDISFAELREKSLIPPFSRIFQA